MGSAAAEDGQCVPLPPAVEDMMGKAQYDNATWGAAGGRHRHRCGDPLAAGRRNVHPWLQRQGVLGVCGVAPARPRLYVHHARLVLQAKALAGYFETLRMLSHVYLRSSDVGEVIWTVKRIDEGDGKSWFDNWTATAAHLEAIGDEFLQSGHSFSARDTFIRAANYYRQAEFFSHDSAANRQLAIDSSNQAVRCFQKALPYFPYIYNWLDARFETS